MKCLICGSGLTHWATRWKISKPSWNRKSAKKGNNFNTTSINKGNCVVNICCFSCNHQPTNQQQAVAIGSQEVGVESQGGVTDGPAALHAERAALVQTPIVAEAPVAHPHTERYDVMISIIMTHSPLNLWNGGENGFGLIHFDVVGY